MVDVICLGEVLVDMFSMGVGEPLEKAPSFLPVPGGAPANVAIGLAKLGVDSALISKIGDDPFGRLLRSVILQNRVDVSQLKVDRESRTTLAFISTREDGERDFCFYRNPGADMMLSAEEISEGFIKTARVFHYGSISMISDPSYSATLKALEYAKKYGLVISYDPNVRLSLWDSENQVKQRIIEGLHNSDLVKLNNDELEFITGISDIKQGSDILLKYGPKMVVVTQGDKGSFSNNGRTCSFVESYKVHTIDTTGCGDSFTSAILAKFLQKIKQGKDPFDLDCEEMEDILRFANAAGALTATKKGVIPSLPTQEDLGIFLNGYGKIN
ncbi:carbohydrate kinase [Candidatus Aerophobetes bacterium]|uniref:Carbohydrate kinase n=2 Tax=root TaxID=1 RepID=A0A523YRJ0_UNCAE|nr:MAG: carbohydrate kinase [Candidatus Aerophobetes bacterium]